MLTRIIRWFGLRPMTDQEWDEFLAHLDDVEEEMRRWYCKLCKRWTNAAQCVCGCVGSEHQG